MNNRRVVLLVMLSLLVFVLPAFAQSVPLVAFVNSGGQLVISSGDGSYRWIVTNPGERLAGDLAWMPNGNQLLYTLADAGGYRLRAADVTQQAAGDVVTLPGRLVSLSGDGSFLFYQLDDGSYGSAALQTGSATPLALTNDVGARYNGLWADALPLVAYWGYSGNSHLVVTNAASTQTTQIDSGRSSPVLPLLWASGVTELIYRDADGQIRSADFACLQNGSCTGNPADLSITTLASGDADIASDGSLLYFRSADTIAAVDLSCAATDTCLNSAIALAANAAPQTALNVAGGTLVYTAVVQNVPEVRLLDLSCISSGSCTPQTVASTAIAGGVSANGRYAVIESGNGLESLDLSTGTRAYLSDRGAVLAMARWQP